MSIMNNERDWHYLLGLEVRGPISLDELAALIASGALPRNVMIAGQTAREWHPADLVLGGLHADLATPKGDGEAQAPDNRSEPIPDGAGVGVGRGGAVPKQGAEPAVGTSQRTPPNTSDGAVAGHLLGRIADKINQVAGTEKLEGFSFGDMFSETFRRRTADEIEDYLIVGTSRTTPPLNEVQTGWPKPWLFARFLLLFGLAYFAFVFMYETFGNAFDVPAVILLGSFTAPFSTLVLFFELNTPRNVSLYRLMLLFLFGSAAATFFTSIAWLVPYLGWLGNPVAGIVEEPSKLLALVLLARGRRYKFILNGMLFGAAVGAGFAAFESAGYALRHGLNEGTDAMMHNIMLRGFVAPFMHVAWTAMVAASLWRVKGERPFRVQMLKDPRFYRVFFLAMALHAVWNMNDTEVLYYVKVVTLGGVAWFVIWGLVQEGLRQVRDEQRAMHAPK